MVVDEANADGQDNINVQYLPEHDQIALSSSVDVRIIIEKPLSETSCRKINDKQYVHFRNELKSFGTVMQQLIDSLTPDFQRLCELTGQLAHHITGQLDTWKPYVTSLTETFEKYTQSCEKFIQSFSKVKDILQEFEWPLHGKIDAADIGYIVRTYNEKGTDARSQIDQYMVHKYDNEVLQHIIERWESRKWLKQRIPILRQAVKAHLEGNYWVSIPAILPQIEGIIIQCYFHIGMAGYKDVKKFLETIINASGGTFMHKAINTFIVDVLLAKFEHGIRADSSFSRHAILHGADTDYGNAANSLKAILLFDQLIDLISPRLVCLPKGNTYHMIGCHVIDMKRPDIELYASPIEAEATGRTPCKLCMPSFRLEGNVKVIDYLA